MKKTGLRITGADRFSVDNYPHITDLIIRMREHDIPFIQINAGGARFGGSRRVIAKWAGSQGDLLHIMVRESDVAMIRLLNTKCRIGHSNHSVMWERGWRLMRAFVQ